LEKNFAAQKYFSIDGLYLFFVMKNIHRITANSLLQSTCLPSEKLVLLQRFQRGGSVIFPTETIYGLGAIAIDAKAVANLFSIKGRSPEKPPPIIVSDHQQLLQLVSEIPPQAKTLMEKFWPGALTIIFPAKNSLPKIICGKSTFDGKEISTIAVRMTSHPLAKKLCEEAGAPLVATSANFSGATGRAAAPQTLDDIPFDFLQKVNVIIDGKVGAGIASTIVDCTVSPAHVLRQGAVELSESDLVM
jgi:L-threonylcarbamoyladenylate synthase